MSDLARNILTTVFCFSKSKGNITHDTIDMQDGVPIHIKDITVIPRTVDHSAYGAFMFEILADGKKVLHSRGPTPGIGYKGKLLKPTLKKIRTVRPV